MTAWALQCMHGADANRDYAGSGAQVTLGEPPAQAGAARETQVYVHRVDTAWRVAAFSAAGAPIRFCGHGALAAARVVFDHGAPQSATLQFASAAQTWSATRAGADAIALAFARPEIELSAPPEFVVRGLQVAPRRAARAGGPDDYWIIETDSAAAVATAQPDAEVICAATARAIVLAAPTADGAAQRYFAPQYGEQEDAATGSAAVQLAAYWHATRAVTELTVTQLSAAGGLMHLRCDATTVELRARVAYR